MTIVYRLADHVDPWDVDWPEEYQFLDRDEIPEGIVDDWLEEWEIVASVDHGLRAGDETMAVICTYLGDLVMGPILQWVTSRSADAWEAVCDELAPYDGGWCEPTADDPYGERAHWLDDELYWHQTWGDIKGVAWETNADAGMTYFATRVRGS